LRTIDHNLILYILAVPIEKLVEDGVAAFAKNCLSLLREVMIGNGCVRSTSQRTFRYSSTAVGPDWRLARMSATRTWKNGKGYFLRKNVSHFIAAPMGEVSTNVS
jgi:hypothetical protein